MEVATERTAVPAAESERDRAIRRFIRNFFYASMTYSLVGFSWGAFMGAKSIRYFLEAPPADLIVRAHAHLNLLGWVEMALFGAIYYIFPRLAGTPWASFPLIKWNFYLHNIGLLGMVALFTLAGYKAGVAYHAGHMEMVELVKAPFMPWVGMCGILVIFANVLLVVNIILTLREGRRKGTA
ncbi:MAG: cbb3-type cytochrome c oxidase subunit I [Nitrospirae bacterium]|nr:cbb3-type cytochrome c oxidase subunit I [Nitrospirota bacterium]